MTVTPERHAAMSDAVAFWRQFTVTWDPQDEGDTVEGVVVALLEFRVRGSDSIPKLKLRADSGDTYYVLASQKRLLAKLHEARVAVGDKVKIRYDGEDSRSAQGMSPTQKFTVWVVRPRPTGEAEAAAE